MVSVLTFRSQIFDGDERLELVRASATSIIRYGLWYHKYYARSTEVRAATWDLQAAGRAAVDGPAARRGDGRRRSPLLRHQPPQGPHREPRLREDESDRQGDG